MELRLLGPLEFVGDDGRMVDLPAGKPRALVGLLGLEAGRVVALARIIDVLWAERPPPTAAKVVQGYVSRLRKLLPDGVLLTRAPGYLLGLEGEQLDLSRFERLRWEATAASAEGHSAVAAERLRSALVLWRGPPLADVAEELDLPGDLARLEELRLTALEDRLEAELALGHGAGLVAEVEALARAYPLRERFRGQLMLALYRAGRQADALAVYQETRAMLVDELGLEPRQSLQQLERAILQQDASLELEITAPAGLSAQGEATVPTPVRKTVSVLVCDVVYPPELGGQLDTESRRAIISRYFEAVAAVLRRNGGTIERFAGDGVVAVFGVPLLREDDAVRAVRAAAELRVVLAELNRALERDYGITLELRIGVDTGEAVTGTERPFVTGEVVSGAVRLQRAAAPDQILLGGERLTLARDAVNAEESTASRLKGEKHAAAAGLIGRVEELERVGRELEVGAGVVLVGEAGIGKTTLWRAAVEQARSGGARVLTAAPAQAEQPFSYAVLGDLLGPLEGERAALPPPQRRALESVLLIAESEEVVELRAVGVAVCSVLEAIGAAGAVVVAIDDVQWTDAASAAVLEFALRRAESVRLLVAVRKGYELPLRVVAATLELERLTVTELHHLLLDRLGAPWSPSALRHLHEVCGGNPFYALELARVNRPGGELVVPESLQGLASDRLRALPSETRRRLAELALAGSVESSPDLDPAFAVGVIEVRDGVLRFAHPLLAEASTSLLDSAQTRALHRQIAAGTCEPDRRARHLALAAEGPDEAVAAELAAAAEGAARRGAVAVAAELWELAGRLTQPRSETLAAERLVEAAIAHQIAGNADAGMALLEANLDRLPRGPLRQRGTMTKTRQLSAADLSLAPPVLERALAEAEDPFVRLEIAHLLAGSTEGIGDSLGARAVARACLREAEAGNGATLVDALWFAAYYEIDCDYSPWPLVERARALPPSPRRGGWPMQFEPREVLARALLRDGELDAARKQLEAWLTEEAEGTSIFTHHGLFRLLATVDVASGNLAAAASSADRLLAEGEQSQAPNVTCEGLLRGAIVALLRGDAENARAQASRALEVAEQSGWVARANEASVTLGLLELSLGNHREAAEWYRRVPPVGWRRWFYWAGGRATIDAIEALSAVGGVDEVRELIATLPADARERAAAEACLAAADGDLDGAIELLRVAPPAPSPFRRARELLLLGRFQRQARHRSEARDTLAGANSEFHRLGAVSWAARVEDELARLGGRSPAGAELTESERRVADLVAAGLSNKEVASRLVVTTRTVEAHLSRIYAKLGMHSRTELAARWHHH